jgi:Type II secretion system (T2SS), protein E, N-terminal domain
VQEGLAAQVVYGARLGTNLIELGHLDLDTLTRGLARRSRIPAALAGHFERRDLAIQSKVPGELAAKIAAVPLGRLAHDSQRIAVAVRDRLSEHARGELAFHLDIDAEQIVEAIAPELRLHYHLELAYQIPRANRFLRVDSRVAIPVPQPSDTVEDTDVEAATWTGDPTPSPVTPSAGALSDSDISPAVLDYQTAPSVDEVTGRARRRLVPALGDQPAVKLARIAVRQVHHGGQQFQPERLVPSDRDELTRAIRRASSRDRVAELVLGAISDLPEAAIDTAIVFVVRLPLAIGWKGFCPGGIAAIESLAMSVDDDSVIARSFHGQAPTLTAVTVDDCPATDRSMWTLLGAGPPASMLVTPIAVADQIVCLLYTHAAVDLAPVRPFIELVTAAAGTAFSRLLRATNR